MRPTRAQLQVEIDRLNRHVIAISNTLKAEIAEERGQRIAAQRGLVPYVRSLEQFDLWLRQHSKLRKQLEPILRELGLWEIKLGYDPDKDVSLSVVSPRRHA